MAPRQGNPQVGEGLLQNQRAETTINIVSATSSRTLFSVRLNGSQYEVISYL